MRRTIEGFDKRMTRLVAASFGQSTRPFFLFMTMLGDPLTVIVATAGLIGYGFFANELPFIIMGATIPATVILGALLKLAFERARPVTEYAMNMKLQTFSFPSGHSSGSTIMFGILAYVVLMKLSAPWSISAAAILALVPLFVGISRVYLGAHFPSDVLAGWALGLLMLAIVLTVIGPLA